ncbi:MAG: hypothetical protein ACKVQR_19340 [Aquabacterium sp.]
MDRLRPLGRTLDEFRPLGPGEQQLLDACRTGEEAVLGAVTPESATDAQRIRAVFLRFLLLGGDDQAPLHERGVRLRGASVEGLLDLDGCRIHASVDLKHCRFDSQIRAMDAQVNGLLTLQGSHLADGLAADRLHCSAGVFLRNEFMATGEVRLLGAQIGGNLDCVGGHFLGKEGAALSVDGAVVKGGVLLKDGFKATGQVSLLGTQIGGSLECLGGQFLVTEGAALSADGAIVKGGVFLASGFKANGAVRLLSAQIGGDLVCVGGQFEVEKGDALLVDRASVTGTVFLRDGFNATGRIRLLGTHIGGNLDCTGGQFMVKEGEALTADGAVVKGTVFLRDGFNATGRVRLLGTHIGGSVDCIGGQLSAKEGAALSADGAVVKGGVLLSSGFKAAGEVRLLGAQIGGDLVCLGGQFEVNEGQALSADRAVVKGNVVLTRGFRATGTVRLPGVQIGGNLVCYGGEFLAKVGVALFLERADVRGAWHLYSVPHPVRVDASHADVSVLVDELAAWAPGSVLNGLRYAALGGSAPTSGTDRLKWLHSQRDDHLGLTAGSANFCPQPWRQVRRVLREMGHAEGAKQVGIAFEDHLRVIGRLGQSPPGTPAPFARLKRVVAQSAHYAFGKLAGYGYRPIRLVAWMVSVWFLFGAAYWWLALPPRSAMAPSDPLVFQNASYEECLPDRPVKPGNWYLCGPLRGEYATFSPLAYSLDVLLPLVDLGQEKTWGAFVPTPKENPLEELFGHFHWGHVARLLTWFETLFGWLSSLLLVAIVSGFSRRNDEE